LPDRYRDVASRADDGWCGTTEKGDAVELRRPPRLRAGDRIAALTLSWGGPGAIPHRYEAGKRQLEAAFGVEVVEMPHTLADPDSVAANPTARADDIHRALADPDRRRGLQHRR
jgi:muramoyltetrapeptide carboxypeptidase LdcA involved in peptidoglycan recycling